MAHARSTFSPPGAQVRSTRTGLPLKTVSRSAAALAEPPRPQPAATAVTPATPLQAANILPATVQPATASPAPALPATVLPATPPAPSSPATPAATPPAAPASAPASVAAASHLTVPGMDLSEYSPMDPPLSLAPLQQEMARQGLDVSLFQFSQLSSYEVFPGRPDLSFYNHQLLIQGPHGAKLFDLGLALKTPWVTAVELKSYGLA
ncbi:MAG TPA: hypothetical protein VEU62_09630 [Bryobacterales bacterium]|nr:hypothetical protein [Bryobacterales bacterium]